MASGDTLLTFHPYQNEPPSSAYATLDTRNLHPVLDFDAATDESAVFTDILPRNYAGGGITVYIVWSATSATSGTCVWAAQWERIGTSQDIDSDSFATANTANGTANGTSGTPTNTSIAFTNGAQIDSVVVGEAFRLKIYRDADNGSDDMTGDAELIMVELKET